MTDRHRQEQALKLAAKTDNLTDLPNRTMFEKRLADLARRHGESPAPYALLLVDLDGFKAVNDTLGHHAGDEVLSTIGAKLRGDVFRSLFCARLGGDEFVILVERARDCAELSSIVRDVLRELRCVAEHDGVRLPVTATVGAAHSANAIEAAGLLRKADLALYAAKRSQRGTGRISGDTTILRPWGGRPAVEQVKVSG